MSSGTLTNDGCAKITMSTYIGFLLNLLVFVYEKFFYSNLSLVFWREKLNCGKKESYYFFINNNYFYFFIFYNFTTFFLKKII